VLDPRSRGLSKSRFVAGLQCLKQLWWRAREPASPELLPGPELAALFERGRRVGAAARERFPGGVLVDVPHHDLTGRVEATRRALSAGPPTIFEASFLEDGVFVAVDVLERLATGWALVEVKSTLKVKPQHLPDVAVQLHVLRRAGLDVRRGEVMHLDPECRHPDLSNLFAREDVMAAAWDLLPGIPGRIRAMEEALAGPLPSVAVGPHCSEPYPCPFWDRCWAPLPDHHVSTLHGLREQRVEELLEAGFETIGDLPEDLELHATAARQARAVREGRLVVEPGLGQALAALRPPVAFLDFETVAPAIPVWPGCRPYEPVPVQMSCHLQGADGSLAHHAFLAEGPGDPRLAVARAVLEACAGSATVVAYHAAFEQGCLQRLAEAVPDLAAELGRVSERLVDLLPVVRDHVYHPDFGGSFSLKRVLPALVPGLGYADLAIADGAVASARLESLLLDEAAFAPADRAALRRQLLAYCERDTLGMMRLAERLRALARDPATPDSR
jgi:hypothetical protein